MTSSSRIGSARAGRRALLVLLSFGLLGLAARALDRRLSCAGIFLRLEQASGPGWLLHYREHAFTTRAYTFGDRRGQLYAPEGQAIQGIVLAHGMHEQGITEPRLVGLARALAAAGYTVLTPEITGLAHYRITHADVDTIAAAARALARELGRSVDGRGPSAHEPRKVIVFGISFGGGMALRAACEPANRGAIERVVALGAHHDASRVSRFYLGEPARGPMAELAQVEPHPYGRVALWRSLFDQPHKGPFSEPEQLAVLRGILAQETELERASPRYCPGPVQVPLFLVHGTGDRVVPYTETLWNQRQFGSQTRLRTLISPAIVHAEYAPPSWWQRLQLIEFMADALG